MRTDFEDQFERTRPFASGIGAWRVSKGFCLNLARDDKKDYLFRVDTDLPVIRSL